MEKGKVVDCNIDTVQRPNICDGYIVEEPIFIAYYYYKFGSNDKSSH